MTAKNRPFFDTNVIVYLASADEAKAKQAERLLAAGGVISVQVLNEFVSVARNKLRLPWDIVEDIRAAARSACHVVPLTATTHEAGVVIAQLHGYHIYDSCIVAAAIEAGCGLLYSEDMQDGQRIGDLTIRNPFLLHG